MRWAGQARHGWTVGRGVPHAPHAPRGLGPTRLPARCQACRSPCCMHYRAVAAARGWLAIFGEGRETDWGPGPAVEGERGTRQREGHAARRARLSSTVKKSPGKGTQQRQQAEQHGPGKGTQRQAEQHGAGEAHAAARAGEGHAGGGATTATPASRASTTTQRGRAPSPQPRHGVATRREQPGRRSGQQHGQCRAARGGAIPAGGCIHDASADWRCGGGKQRRSCQ
jgi:hypothetical protein